MNSQDFKTKPVEVIAGNKQTDRSRASNMVPSWSQTKQRADMIEKIVF